MKLKLLKTHGNLKPGREWNCPWAALGKKLIEEGVALAIEPADLHLNPSAEPKAEADEAAETETAAETAPPTEGAAEKAKRIQRRK